MNSPSSTPADAIVTRRSIRAFKATSVARAVIEEILSLAARAPSGSNIQPWQVTVLTGKTLSDLGGQLAARSLAGDHGESEYAYYPTQWTEPYLGRRRAVGWGLYDSVGIERGQTDKIRQQHARNFVFFDAPVGLLFTIDRRLEIGSWLDYGMFLQNIMIAARGAGLHTCPQAAFAIYHKQIAEILKIPAEQQLICGMALGYADPEAPENNFPTERASVSEFTTWLD